MNTVIGHAAIAERFAAALGERQLHHAWLLHGVKGIGKATLARTLARRYLCEHGDGCGHCHACQMFAAGSHPDLRMMGLIEGKRDFSIEQVRELLGFLALSGGESGRRVMILDDADRMNPQAANALLKGLEEPASGSLLLIVCHDLMRLPATVRSRCLLQHCSPLDDEQARRVLAGMQVEEKYFELAVDLADGCPGNVACMQDAGIAGALLEWRQLATRLADADVGNMEAWIRKHVQAVPHALIAKALLHSALASKTDGFAAGERRLQAMWACARWPGEVLRHSLRPAPSLLAAILQLRSALRG